MLTIYKYPLKLVEIQTIRASKQHFYPLSVQVQNNEICLWAEIETNGFQDDPYSILICGTGQQLPNMPSVFIGTVQKEMFVWHIYLVSKM